MSHAGVDGCRGGWTVATASGIEVVPLFADVLSMVDGIIAVDMPIGLLHSGARECDRAARRAVGPRRSSVFAAPARSALAAESFADTTGISIQAWNLVPKIREVDDIWEPRVVEAFPELVFAVLAGAPMAHPKRTPDGHAERLAVLGLDVAPKVRGAARDDVVDALACLRAADRYAAGTAVVLGDTTARDEHGRPMFVIG